MMGLQDPVLYLPGLRVLRELYAALDSDFVTTHRYVEPVPENMESYSIEFSRLLQSACTGIDSTFRLWYLYLTHEVSEVTDLPVRRKLDFPDYHPLLSKLLIDPKHTLSLGRNPSVLIAPFLTWTGKDGVPDWWTAHNKTKHELDRINFKRATLENAMNALGGFYLALTDGRGTRTTHPPASLAFKDGVW